MRRERDETAFSVVTSSPVYVYDAFIRADDDDEEDGERARGERSARLWSTRTKTTKMVVCRVR